MEKIYSEYPNACKLAISSQETVKFIMSYSKSLQVTEYQEIQFETILN